MIASKKDGTKIPTYNNEFSQRISLIVDALGGNKVVTEKYGLGISSLQKWKAGTSMPSFKAMVDLCESSGYNLHWLATGQGPQMINDAMSQVANNVEILRVPEYELPLAAGAGADIIDAPPLNYMAFPKPYFLAIFGRDNAKGLFFCTVDGDSMTPTLSDGDLVLIDRQKTAMTDGVLAYTFQDVARVKRIVFQADHMVIYSDNRDLYPDPERLTYDQARAFGFKIIGRPIWSGRHFG